MAFGKSKEELTEIFQSDNFLTIIEKNISEYTFETTYTKLENSTEKLKKRIVDFSTDKVALELINDRNIVVFFIHFSWVWNRFSIDECYSIDANRFINITEKKPLDFNSLVSKNGRIYYEDKNSSDAYEIRFWPLIVEKLKPELHNQIHIEEIESYKTIVNDRDNNVLQDYFYFQSEILNHKSNYWHFDNNKFQCYFEKGLIHLNLFAEYNHFRELYSEWTLNATFNLKTAELIIINSSFNKWNYK
tara:strand:- start:144 stop:881 length:738 start_codon:yes stop_codon:yes gene_type:complete